MAHYGIQAQVTAKTVAKRSPGLEKAVLAWIFEVIGEPVPEVAYEDALRDGVALCKLINVVKPGSVAKFHTSGSGYQLMENINKFIKAAQDIGVPHDQLFRTVDLYEKKNIPEVTGGLIAVARTVCTNPDYKGPQIDKWVFANN
jgi:type I site-specific restriction endonuclease